MDDPGYEGLVAEVSTLFSTNAPPFLYVNDPVSPRIACSVLESVLTSLSRSQDASPRVFHAQVNSVACFTPRIFYDSVLNQLAQWEVKWTEGCSTWRGDDDQKWNENLDAFIHGLKAVSAHRVSGKGKGKQTDTSDNSQLVIVVERAERLQDQIPDLVVPLTRLTELAQLRLSVIFVSDVPWEDIRPPFGGSPDPYYLDVSPLSKDALLRRLLSAFCSTSDASTANPYHPSLSPLYSQFLSLLLDTCSTYIQDPNELQYIAAARWPGFVQPVLDDYRRQLDNPDMDDELRPPPEEVRMRLLRLFKPSFTTALETLYPRFTDASAWAAANRPDPDLLMKPPSEARLAAPVADPAANEGRIADLPRMSKFILVAAYLASTNPHTSDLRMFGRGLDEKKRKRRARKSSAKSGGPSKIPQRLVGPNPFPLDRILAILGALLEEHDADKRPPVPEYTVPGEYTDMEIARVGVYTSIVELADIGLLHRSSAAEKLDGPPMFKCGVSYETASTVARQLDVPLNDLLWDPA